MSKTYTYFRENCALCGDDFPKRDLNKILMAPSHISVSTPKKLCGICDNCYPKILDFLEVSEPEFPERKAYGHRRWCMKCYQYVGKTDKYCPTCGDNLDAQKPEWEEILQRYDY